MVARYVDGSLIKGYSYDFAPGRPCFHVFPSRDASAEPTAVRLSDLKAVFFVRDFVGNAAYNERKRFAPGERSAGRRVQVVFREVLVGSTDEDISSTPGLCVTPADPASNNVRVYAVSTAIRQVRYFAADQPPTIPIRAPVREAVPSPALARPDAVPDPATPTPVAPEITAEPGGPDQAPTGPIRATVDDAAPSPALARPDAVPDHPAPTPGAPARDPMKRFQPHPADVLDPLAQGSVQARPHRAPTRQRLGQFLLERGIITEGQLAHALSEKGDTGERLGHVLVRLGLITESELVDSLSALFAIPTVAVPENGADPPSSGWCRH